MIKNKLAVKSNKKTKGFTNKTIKILIIRDSQNIKK